MNKKEEGMPTAPARTAQNIGVEVYPGRELAAFPGREQPRGVPWEAAFAGREQPHSREVHRGGRAVILIAAGARLPAACAMTFTTVSDRQRAIEVRVVRCSADARPSGVVGRFLLPGLCDGARGEARIDIGLSLDQGGVLRAWAADRASGARQEASFAGLWALEPELRPDARAALARRVDAGIDRVEDGAREALRTDRDEAEDGPSGRAAWAGSLCGLCDRVGDARR